MCMEEVGSKKGKRNNDPEKLLKAITQHLINNLKKVVQTMRRSWKAGYEAQTQASGSATKSS